MRLVNKIRMNYGSRAFKVLGAAGYARYLLVSILNSAAIVREKSLRPVDRGMTGLVRLRHLLNSRRYCVDLDSYRDGDVEEGSFAFGLLREIWLRDVYLRHFDLPARLGCVVDLGANRGIFSLQAAAVAERVVAVEPMQAYSKPLARNLEINAFANVIVVNAMVGGRALMGQDGFALMPLREIMAMAQGLPIDLVKIDIEGSEFGLDLECLRPAKRLAMEVHPQWGNAAELIKRVESLGFECRTFDESLAPVAAEHADFVLAINCLSPDARWAS